MYSWTIRSQAAILTMHRDMGLYDDRLADLSEARHSSRVAWRRTFSSNPVEAPRPSMSAQSLLFDRSAGWTSSKAKAWAQSHSYRYGKVDVTDQYIRIRQFDPKGSKVKRTIPFGRGIRAVVAREDSMRTTTVKSPRRRRAKKSAKKSAKRAPVKRARRRSRKVAVAAPRRAKTVARKTRRRSRRVKTNVMEASKRRRRVRRRRPMRAQAWKGNSEGHSKAARKGHRRRKARKTSTRKRRRSKVREVAAPRRRRHSRRAREATPQVMESSRKRRRYHRAHAPRLGGSGMGLGAIAIMVGTAGTGFLLADGVDRFLATYNPASTDPKPTDKFTSDGTGTLANALNVAAMPDWKRFAASAVLTAVPAGGSLFVKNSYGRAALEGLAIGSGINLLKMVWGSVIMPLLIGKDTSSAALQKNYIARLYPAEVASSINKKSGQAAPGALSAPADAGPFALADESPYPTATQALRDRTGVHGDSPYPTTAAALRTAAGMGGDSSYPSAAEALRKSAGVSWQPGPPAGSGPGPQEGDQECGGGCVGEVSKLNPFLGFIGDQPEATT